MFRKFFAAVILAVFMLNVQIVAAEDYDWSKAPRIGTKAQLARYIENERRKGNTKIHAVLTYFKFSSDKELAYKERRIFEEELINRIAIARARLAVVMGTGRLIYELVEYPGTRVANAYLSREPHMAWKNLTAEEQKLYNIAVGIVDEAKKRPSEKEKARYIHDAIHERVKIFETIDGATAIDAIIRGKTDCEGFADAFYTVGRIAGLNVGRIRGTINNSKTNHAWNWITLEDGRTYCVDVSQDWIEWKNGSNKYKYFIVPSATMKNNTYWCEWSIIPNLQ